MNFKARNIKKTLFFRFLSKHLPEIPGKGGGADAKEKKFPDCKILFPLYLIGHHEKTYPHTHCTAFFRGADDDACLRAFHG